MKSLFLLVALGLSACTQSARITLRNESGRALAYATTGSKDKGVVRPTKPEALPSGKLAAGQAVKLPLVAVVSRGLDLPFVMLGTNVASHQTLQVWQDQAKAGLQFALPGSQASITQRWAEQDFLGRWLTRNLGSMVIVDPAEASYWKPFGLPPVKLQVSQR